MMDRAAWLAERRAAVRAQYDEESSTYDANEYPVPLHGDFVDRVLRLTEPGGLVLDAPCGTGRWFAAVVASGRRVVGVDQSAGMLAVARGRGLAAELQQTGLQELAYHARFDAAMTIDAMENVPPEDWPLVAANLRRALKPQTHLYLTLEEVDEVQVHAAHEQHSAAGLPTVPGEVIEGDVAGYHYYPGRARALEWLGDAGFELIDEGYDQQDGWAYRHLILRAR
jgi:SAM-dependent methyltransferase